MREAGNDVIYVAELASGSTDAEVLAFARDEDRDFGDSVYR
jgi:hypothetical protein